jgi:hypothetical protein
MNSSITPEWLGAVITIGIQLVILLSAIYLRSLTMDSLKSTAEFITSDIAKAAWLETKGIYYKSKGAFSRHELLTYRRCWVRRYCLNAYISTLQKGKVSPPPRSIKDEIRSEVKPSSSDHKAFYRNAVS